MEPIITVVIMIGNCVGLLYKQYYHNDNVYITYYCFKKEGKRHSRISTIEYELMINLCRHGSVVLLFVADCSSSRTDCLATD